MSQTNNDVQHKINYLLTDPPPIQHSIQSKINFLLKHIPHLVPSSTGTMIHIPPSVSPPSVSSPSVSSPSVSSPSVSPPSVSSPSVSSPSVMSSTIDSVDSKLYDALIRTTDINNGTMKTRDEMLKVSKNNKIIVDVKETM